MSMHGAGCDNLLSATIVLPDGRQVKTSDDSNPDHFRAIRGGGGNVGVATGFEYRLHQVDKVLAGALTYPPEQFGMMGQVNRISDTAANGKTSTQVSKS